MRLAQVLDTPAIVLDAGWLDIAAASAGRYPDLDAALASWPEFLAWADRLPTSTPVRPLDPRDLRAPLRRPGQVIGVGLNYADHVSTAGLRRADLPVFFTKLPASLSGPYADVPLPSDAVECEAELVVVIGRAATDVPVEQAWSRVAAVTVGQDFSARNVQRAGQLCLAKSFPGFGPLGPWLVTPDDLDRPTDLRIRCTVNGRTVQDARTTDMLTPVADLLAIVSSVTTLSPGDVIFTGTPVRRPEAAGTSTFLRPGDIVRTSIDGVGRLENACVPGRSRTPYHRRWHTLATAS